MAENKDGQEKSEQPTGKKINDAREKGQVTRSRELSTLVMMVLAAATLIVMGGDIIRGLMKILEASFTVERARLFDTQTMIFAAQDYVLEGMWVVAPFFAVMVVGAILSALPVGGLNFSLKAMAPKANKLSPLAGIKRIFGRKGLVELIKAIGKVAVIGFVAVVILSYKADLFLIVGYQDLDVALEAVGTELVWIFLLMSLSLIVISLIDVPFQLYDAKQQLMMTKQEVKDEGKQQEGSPETKARIRQAQRQMAQRRMMANVPEADVVITNPTHYAIAVKYDANSGGAPLVVAKGADVVAARIREIAKEHRVPILSSPALARAIFHHTEIDEEIPAGLYEAVAKILAYIYQLKAKPGTDFSKPLTLEDVSIPEDLRRDH